MRTRALTVPSLFVAAALVAACGDAFEADRSERATSAPSSTTASPSASPTTPAPTPGVSATAPPISALEFCEQAQLSITRWELPHVRFHDLRHSASTLLQHLRVQPRLVQALLGHSSVQLTLDVYTHAPDEDLREAMDLLDAWHEGG